MPPFCKLAGNLCPSLRVLFLCNHPPLSRLSPTSVKAEGSPTLTLGMQHYQEKSVIFNVPKYIMQGIDSIIP